MDVTAKAPADSSTMSGPLVPRPAAGAAAARRWEAAGAAARAACAAFSLLSLTLLVSSEQRGELNLFGITIPLHSKWSFSDSLEYLLAVSVAVLAHSTLQLLMSARRMVRKAPVVPSRRHAWIIFAGDQAFAYAMMSASSAASGVTNLNRTGIRHSALPDFCKPLRRFCNRMTVSIVFAFLSFLCLAVSAILDVLWLSKY